MVKILVKNDAMVPSGTILEPAYIDGEGDARLSANDEEKYGTAWVFKLSFELVDEGRETNGYRVILTAQNALDVHNILDSLPTAVVESAILEKI